MGFLFSGLYEDITDIDLYLERIDYLGDRRPTLDNLKELVDFIPLNYYASMAETSPVTQGIIVEMFTERGTASIFKKKLRISSDDIDEERIIETEYDLKASLWEVFGIKISGE